MPTAGPGLSRAIVSSSTETPRGPDGIEGGVFTGRCQPLPGPMWESKTLDRLSLPCPLTGIEKGAWGSPSFPETLTRPLTMPLIHEATVGLEPTHEGFSGPDLGESDPHAPLAGFRVTVCVFSTAWRTQTLDRLPGPFNRHNCSTRSSGRLHQQGDRVKIGTPLGICILCRLGGPPSRKPSDRPATSLRLRTVGHPGTCWSLCNIFFIMELPSKREVP